MVKNDCTPANIYGPFEHTLFLGCSVSNFSVSLGWNEQQSQLTVQLVEDPCTAPAAQPKYYWDASLNKTSTTAADPGFMGESQDIIGCPAYFRVGDFEYSGIIQNWERTSSSTANPSYSVSMIDPRQILGGTYLIINEYSGPISNGAAVFNTFNVYGFMEQFGVPCPQMYQSAPCVYSPGNGSVDGPVFGTAAGGFGGANVNDNGMQWNRMISAFNILANQTPKIATPFSPHGRVMYRGTDGLGGYGLMPRDNVVQGHRVCEYFVDVSEVPAMPTYYRMNGSNVGLLDSISQVCEEAGYDYYIELVPVRGQFGLAPSGIGKFIKIRTAYRGAEISGLSQIPSFISSSPAGTMQNSYGRELRNEITSSFVIGGPKQSFYQACANDDPDGQGDDTVVGINALTGQTLTRVEKQKDENCVAGGDDIEEGDDTIVPFFGLDSSNNMIIPWKEKFNVGQPNEAEFWCFDRETFDINEALRQLGLPACVKIHEYELMAVIGGLDAWLALEHRLADMGMETDIGNVLKTQAPQFLGVFNMDKIIEAIKNGGDLGENKPMDLVEPRVDKQGNPIQFNNDEVRDDVNAIFEWLREIASQYWGKQYAVRVPFVCGWYDSESTRIMLSEEPTNSGWSEVTPIIGLPNATALTDFFRDEQGKLTTFIRMDNADQLEVSVLDNKDFGIWPQNNGDLYMRASVQETYVYHDSTIGFAPRAVITLAQPIHFKSDQNMEKRIVGLARLLELTEHIINNDGDFDNIEEDFKDLAKNVGMRQMFFYVSDIPKMPDAAAFGIKSNTLTYGPWHNPGPPGQVRIDHQEGLVPWEYGGFSVMGLAGQSIADEGLVRMQIGENGSVQVPGYPDIPLGSEIGATNGGFGGGAHLIENRSGGAIADISFNATIAGGGAFASTAKSINMGGGWTGLYGPNITDIQVSVGEQGATTTYNLKTFTPKWGRFGKYNAERLRTVGRNRMNAARNIRAFNLQRAKGAGILNEAAIRGANRIKRLKAGAENLQDDPMQAANTIHEVFVGKIMDWTGTSGGISKAYKRPNVGSMSNMEASVEMQNLYDEKAFGSLDTLIRPISLNGRGDLPRFPVNARRGNCKITSQGAQPPVYDNDGGDCATAPVGTDATRQYYAGNVASPNDRELITSYYLNPMSNPDAPGITNWTRLLARNKSDTDETGHDMEILGRTGDAEYQTPGSGMAMHLKSHPYLSDYANDYSFLALRGPLVLTSWGYDTDGKPIPNKADTESGASQGFFVHGGLECKFMDDHLRKPHTWPTAPVDLRYDRDRGVWVSPPGPRDLAVELCEDLCPFQAANARIDKSWMPDAYDCNGDVIGDPLIEVYSRAGECALSGTKMTVTYDVYSCTYYINERNYTDLKGAEITSCFDRNSTQTTGRIKVDCSTGVTDRAIPINIPLEDKWGPVCSGMEAWVAIGCDQNGCLCASIVNCEHIANWICFTTLEDLNCAGQTSVTISSSWDGIDPTSTTCWSPSDISVDFCDFDCCECFPAGTQGMAVLDTENSDCNNLIYKVTFLDQMWKLSATNTCNGVSLSDECVKTIEFTTGFKVEKLDDCDFRIGVDFCFGQGDGGISTGPSGCDEIEPPDCTGGLPSTALSDGECVAASRIYFGGGLQVFQDPLDPCAITVQPSPESLPSISGVPIKNLQFCTGCFTVEFDEDQDGCCPAETGTVCLAGTSGSPEVVVDVVCSGSGEDAELIVTTTFLNFSECGLFQGTSEEAMFA